MIELYNFLENNRTQIISALLTRIPKDIPAYSRVARNDLKQSLEYLLEAYTDLLVTGNVTATAAAVAADIADVMAGAVRPVFQAPAGSLRPFQPVDPSRSLSRAYLRFLVKDEPGVIAAVSETLAEAGVSIESFLQKPVENAEGVPIVLTTHEAAESVLAAAIEQIAGLPAVLDRPRMLRIARI